MRDESTVLLLDAPALPPELEQVLSQSFQVESVSPDQVSGTLLITAPQAIVTPYRHVDEVTRALR